ncbi:MAG TPA: MFS transporter [Syntrophorhabdaceae bacterium]|nr:MFS transporter [Syntrophorhabdaceae bacterium]
MDDKQKLWSRDFLIVTIINFFIYIVFYLLMATIASYTINNFNASTSIAGLASGIFIIGILFGRLGTGNIIEGIGSKKILIIGTLSYAIVSALYISAINIPLLILIRFLHGFAYGIASTATGTIVAQVIPISRRGEGIGYYSMSQILATALGPFLGIFLIRYVNFKVIFIITSFIAIMSFAISIFIRQPVSGETKNVRTSSGPERKFKVSNFIEGTAIPISILIMILGFNYSSILTFISLYSKELNLEKIASFFFIVYSIVVVFSRPISGRLLDAKGPNFVIYPCLLLFSIGLVVLSLTERGATFLLSAAIIGLGYGNFLSCGQAISIKNAPPNRLGLATATYYIFLDIGFGIGPYLFGSLISFMGYKGLYMFMAIVTLASIPLYLSLVRR